MRSRIFSSKYLKTISKGQLWMPAFIALGFLLAFPVTGMVKLSSWSDLQYSALQNQMNAEETLTFSICVQKAGEIWNAIPDEAFFSGTSRYFSRPAGEKVLALIKKTCTNVADVHGCRVEFEPYTKVLMEPVINDQEVVEETAQKLTQMCGPQVLGEHGLWFASETFCKYLNKYPGALGFLGIANPDLGSGAAHHNSRFDVDELALLLGVCAELSFALR